MRDTAVLVAAGQLGDAICADVFAACRRAGAQPVAWPAASESSGGAAGRPLLLVAALPPGERRIPAEIVDVAVRLDLPVLLVCREPLVRPLVATHGGRVTLLGQPASSARIQGTVRMLLAGRGVEVGGATDESLGPLAWTATFAPAGEPAPLASQADDGSVTAVLPLVGGAPAAASASLAALTDLANLARADLSDDQTLALLSDRLGVDAAMVHLDAASAAFTLYWPTRPLPFIYSRLRLPNLCALTALSPERRLYRVAASHGDLLLAVLDEWTSDAGLVAVLADGGPAFLARLEGRAPALGVLAEVR